MGAVSPALKVLDRVKLKNDRNEVQMLAGSIGMVVKVLDDNKGIAVEFPGPDGPVVIELVTSEVDSVNDIDS